MAKRLERRGKEVALVTYDTAEHDFRAERDRIDLLTRIGEFLAAHLEPGTGT